MIDHKRTVPNESQNPVVTPEQLEFVLRLERIFMPHTTRQRQEMFKNEGKDSRARFIHYTSAEAALSIIKSKRIWMRNTICMSDYSEVQHGFDIFSRFFATEANRTAFIGALDSAYLAWPRRESIYSINGGMTQGSIRTSLRFRSTAKRRICLVDYQCGVHLAETLRESASFSTFHGSLPVLLHCISSLAPWHI